MTYGEAIDKKKEQTEQLYNDFEALRDTANEEEKINWNNLRRLFYQTDEQFRQLNDKAHAANRLDMKLEREY